MAVGRAGIACLSAGAGRRHVGPSAPTSAVQFAVFDTGAYTSRGYEAREVPPKGSFGSREGRSRPAAGRPEGHALRGTVNCRLTSLDKKPVRAS